MDAPADPWVPRTTRRSDRSDRSDRADPPRTRPDVVSGGRLGARLGDGLAGRWEVDRRTAFALLIVIVLVGVVVGAWVLRHQDVGTPIPAATVQVTGVPSAAAPAAPAATSPLAGASSPAGAAPTVTAASVAAGASPSATPVRVQVVGQVRRPGVVSLPVGARVENAVNAAGGATRRADLAAVDLARPVVDGEQIYLSRPGEKPHVLADPGPAGSVPAAGAAGVGSVAGSAGAAPVNLNTSTAEQLDALPGVGPVLAQRIVQWRQQHGRFSTVDELSEVQGIGDATLEKLRPLVAV